MITFFIERQNYLLNDPPPQIGQIQLNRLEICVKVTTHVGTNLENDFICY